MVAQSGLTKNASVQTVLVTGAAGLIGSAVVRLLLSRNIKVVACDDFSIGEWRGDDDHLTWEQLGVSSPSLAERLSTHNFDVVVHCAAHPGGRSLIEPALDVEVNALGSMRLFEWCAKSGTPVVYTSSSIVYGEQSPHPIPESAPLNPGTIYGVCKVACENFLRILGEGYGLKWIILRLFATYGAGHRPSTHQGIVNIMLTQLLDGNRVVVKGPLTRVRDLLYVEDAAYAIYKSIFAPGAYGRIINVGTGIPITIYGLIEALCGSLGRQMRDIEIIEKPGTIGDPFYSVADYSKARDILGFMPQYDLAKGLSEIVSQRKISKTLIQNKGSN